MRFQPLRDYLIREFGRGKEKPILASAPLVEEAYWRIVSAIGKHLFAVESMQTTDGS